MDGVQVLEALETENIQVPVIVISARFRNGCEADVWNREQKRFSRNPFSKRPCA